MCFVTMGGGLLTWVFGLFLVSDERRVFSGGLSLGLVAQLACLF